MRVRLVYNPVAGQRDVAGDLKKVVAFLSEQGWQVDLCQTMGPGDAITFAREAAASGYDMAVAVGGDGTIGEVATGLALTDCALGVLPVGTGNVWAHMLRLPIWSPMNRSSLLDAARVLVTGETRCIDLGRANERYFVLWSGIGFDAQVARDVEPHRDVRRSLGNLAYVVAAVAEAIVMRGTRVTITIDERTMRMRAVLILVSNAQLYGPSWQVLPEARLDDGLLDVCILKGGNTLDLVRHLVMILTGHHVNDPRIEIYRATEVRVRADKPLPLHLDGDPVGYTPVTIRVVPKALKVIVPQWATLSQLFQGGHEQPEISIARRIAARLALERERWRTGRRRLRDDLERRLKWLSSDERNS